MLLTWRRFHCEAKKMSLLILGIRQNLLLTCAAFRLMMWQHKQRKISSPYSGEQNQFMFRPAALFIGLRYTRAKRRNHFISFIAMFSMIGIALGVAVLITVLSVMNGFDREIRERVFSMVPAITVGSVDGVVSDWHSVQKEINNMTGVTATAPFVTGEVLLSYSGSVQAALLSGVLPDEERKVTQLADKMVQGKITDLQAGKFGIVLGEELAGIIHESVGDKVTVVTPQVSMSPAGVIPRFKRFTVVGIFRAGSG